MKTDSQKGNSNRLTSEGFFSQDEKSEDEPKFTNPNSMEFIQIFQIYKHKLTKLRRNYELICEMQKFWNLLPHTPEGEIEKINFIFLFSKILKFLLPIYNFNEINTFLESEWILLSKEKSTIDFEMFSKYLFKFIHIWCVHINKYEYLDMLTLIYERITKKIKILENGTEVTYLPSIKINLLKTFTGKEYQEKTWEFCNPGELLDSNLMEYPSQEDEENEEVENRRPNMEEEYNIKSTFLIYDEKVFYKESEELENLKKCETIQTVLMNDDEIIILGYPTQYIVTFFKNNADLLEDIQTKFENDAKFIYPFNSDYKPYQKHTFYLTVENDENVSLLKDICFMLSSSNIENNNIILCRDVFYRQDSPEIPSDFVEDELYILNNLRRNVKLDRYVNFQEIKLPDSSRTFINIDNLIIPSTHRKALENVVKNEKIGIKSDLWSEKIHQKLEGIIIRKFALIHKKLLYFILNNSSYSSVIEAISKEIFIEKENRMIEAESDFEYFKRFQSKMGITIDKWDSDYDIIEEANKKSPVILVIGVPLCGKSSVCKKLAEDLNMVYLQPDKFFEGIMAKVAKFEEDMQNLDEGAQDQDGDDDPSGAKKEPKKKPGLDSVLSKLELDIYNELMSGKEISQENMINLYKHIIYSDLALSRGLIIDQNSSVCETSFAHLLFDGHLGNLQIDYVINLKIPQEELDLRIQSLKLNLKTLQNINKRDIELMLKPKVPKKEIYEDEIVEPEEGEEGEQNMEEQQPELSDEQKELIPTEKDLIEITDFENIFKSQLEFYYDVMYPKFEEFFKQLKRNYYLEVNITGLDFDEVADLVKAKLDFTKLPRNIPQSLDPSDYKDLLMAKREGILPYRKWSLWKQIDPVALKENFLILNGNPEFGVEYFGRVFLFINEENKNRFIENPKKYLLAPPKVPKNYRVCILGPSRSGKNTVADFLSETFGWKKVNITDIFEAVKEYQRKLEDPEPNSVYSNKIHFSAGEYKDMTIPNKKGERKPENFYSKIVFMLDHLGVKLDKKKTYEEFLKEIEMNSDKFNHVLRKLEKQRKKEEERRLKEEQEKEMQNLKENSKMGIGSVNEEVQENQGEHEPQMTPTGEDGVIIPENKENSNSPKNGETLHINENSPVSNVNMNEISNANINSQIVHTEGGNLITSPDQEMEQLEEVEEEEDPYPEEEEYIIEDLKSDQFYYAFNPDGTYPRPGGFIILNHPSNQEEIEKFAEFNIVFDKVIYLTDQSEEPLKALAIRKNPNFSLLDEEKQNIELEKLKAEVTKIEESLTLLKEKYNTNNEECVIEINCTDRIENIKLKLIQSINPFYTRIDSENTIFSNADVNLEEKAPIQKGEFGIFCPVTYKNERWLFYSGEEFEVQVNQRKYRFASEKEQEMFRRDPTEYLMVHNTPEEDGFTSMTPVNVPPPHIFITGLQGSGVSYYTNLLSREFKLKKREIKKEFMEIWDKQSGDRKEIRMAKKREELVKKNEEIKQNNLADPSAEPQELLNIENELANDPTLEEEEEGFNPADNDKIIFKKLFFPESASVYDSSWFDINEKIQTQFLEFLLDTRRVPNVMVVVRVSKKTILDRHLHLEDIKQQHKKLEEVSIQKKKAAVEKLIQEKKEARLEELKAEIQDGAQNDEENPEGENQLIKSLPELKDIEIQLTQEEEDEIMLAQDPDLPELETMITGEREKLEARYENNMNFLNTLIESLREKLIPVIEINNDLSTENVYKNLLFQINPYIKNRQNLIEKQLVVSSFPEVTLRKTQELIFSGVYKLSSYGLYSPVNPEKLVPRTAFPLLYRDKLYFFNNEDERNLFAESPLNYRTGKEFPLDIASSPSMRNIIYTVGVSKSGRTTLSRILEGLGYYRLSIRRAIMDLLATLQDCKLKRDIEEVLLSGSSIDDNLAVSILSRRISMSDIVGRDLVIDGFPYTLSQARLLAETDPNLTPAYLFNCECSDKEIIKRMKKCQGFKSLTDVIHERFTNSKDQNKDVIEYFKNKKFNIKYFDMERSLWYCKDLVIDILEKRKKHELLFISNYNLNKPSLLSNILPSRVLKNIIYSQREKSKLNMFSPVGLKIKNEFSNCKHINDCESNNIIFANGSFFFLKNEEEVTQFMKNTKLFQDFVFNVKDDLKPPKIHNFEKIAATVHIDKEVEENHRGEHSSQGSQDNQEEVTVKKINFEYQGCCPVTISEEKIMKEGKLIYVLHFKMGYYKFDSGEKMRKFMANPEKFFRMTVPVKKVIEDNPKLIDYQINFENTVNYLETNFASLITKGMLELSKNRIKYPFLSVKETSIKYLALFLKANNPNNNEYAKAKYKKKFDEFLKNAKIPFDLLNVHDNYQKEENPLKKELIRKQLNNLSVKYDDLIDKAKTLKNTRFVDFFKSTSE
jgi:adenylate kinase family enzyme/YHS domain-containing protein